MTAPSSIDPAQFLHEHLAAASPDLLRSMLTTFINTLMSAEADAICVVFRGWCVIFSSSGAPADDLPAAAAGRAKPRLGMIGAAVLATLLPPRRPRYSNRNVKCSTSRYHARDDGRPALPTAIVAIDITVHTPPINLAPTRRCPSRQRHRRHHEQRQFPPGATRPATRRERVTAILLSEPRHDWHGIELAKKLQVTQHNLLTQLSEWARLGFIERTGKGTYALDTPPPGWPPTTLANPDPLTFPRPLPGATAVADGDEERGKVQRPQRSEDERPCAATSVVHDSGAPGQPDTPSTASWTRPPTR